MKINKNSKSYGRTILISGLVWAVVYIGALLVVKELSPGKTLGLILSFLPALAFAFFIFWFSKGISAMDELEVRIYLEAAVIAFCLSILMLMTLGLLDLVVTLNKEDWGYRHLVPYFFVFYFLGLFIARKKYQGHEE